MKIKIFFFLLIIAVLTVSCTSDYSEPYYNNKIVKVPNLIQIETKNQYHLNDTLFVNVEFSRYLPEMGYTDLLDIYKTTLSYEFDFNFSFYKETAYANWAYYDVKNSVVIKKGVKNPYSLASLYNSANEKYELRFGIPLKETGNFKLTLHNEMGPLYSFGNNGILVHIITTVNNPDVVVTYNNSEYSFLVN